MSTEHTVTIDHAAKYWNWIQTRGGLAIWKSVNLANPGASWTTPAHHEDGTPTSKPNWQCSNTPEIVIDPAAVRVLRPVEAKRFRVAIRVGAQGLSFKLTDTASNRVRREIAKAARGGFEAWHTFDYETQEAVIWRAVPAETLREWAEKSA